VCVYIYSFQESNIKPNNF